MPLPGPKAGSGPDAGIEQHQLAPGVHHDAVERGRQAVGRQEGGAQHVLHLLRRRHAAAEGRVRAVQRDRPVGDDGAFEAAEAEAVPAGDLAAALRRRGLAGQDGGGERGKSRTEGEASCEHRCLSRLVRRD
jgi:hypothetical protein